MPIIGTEVTLAYKMLPVLLAADGSSTISLRTGYISADGSFTGMTEKVVVLSPAQTNEILGGMPEAGLTRREDMSKAVYQYMLDNGHVEGTIV